MKKLLLFVLLMAGLSAYAQKDSRIVIGTVDTVYSKVLNEKRTIRVHVPEGGKNQHYPVLYILDGEDHFLSAVGITEEMSGVIPPMIVVGIDNMGFNTRERDLTPTIDPKIAHSGGGENFISFMEKELIPYIESRYATANYRVYSGHSLAGLAVVNALFNHAESFNAYIALDPSVWWDDQRWIKIQEPKLSQHNFKGKSLFIAIANNIPPGLDSVSVLKSNDQMSLLTRAVIPFVHAVRDAKPAGLRWASKFYPTERHGTVEMISEYDALRYIFNYYQFRTSQFVEHPELDEDSVLAAHFQMISGRLGYTVLPTENTINELAYDCMGRHKMPQAYKLFIRNTQLYPNSANAFDSLGDYYVAAGDKQKAIEVFTKSLSIQEVADTRNKLNDLKK
ncbi:alpha/beta hydrolase-fold protein [Mucilaginibacter sp. BT774]|uniref:alpha/beta hydrolase-fold protein n=1 Tax=Mucilaginibacter sp. BT774 TaxID=3062276 RepID=UPI002674609E|nr:alpha/beta hydrolase-fold protein [Mucilaginibacter sp. BT774]MDO3626943.1 alpha/beta hydrolase-fold protein [Mucilaginibacter sp. BT774]